MPAPFACDSGRWKCVARKRYDVEGSRLRHSDQYVSTHLPEDRHAPAKPACRAAQEAQAMVHPSGKRLSGSTQPQPSATGICRLRKFAGTGDNGRRIRCVHGIDALMLKTSGSHHDFSSPQPERGPSLRFSDERFEAFPDPGDNWIVWDRQEDDFAEVGTYILRSLPRSRALALCFLLNKHQQSQLVALLKSAQPLNVPDRE